ncbi:transient receptor potential cation channel subfamily A member 1 homolog [Homarus americanus]|uniref:transient receptor potential cation channel subfamily A member 1 homolog n=1 Tax=Homarus americanus TaxID=6706 RepID=UPI001C453541|nr:transient receptor potential cation channel subfamily A member 1 homolog [Homarus americanus]XP_042220133.1 transient receptor potential cation channel subfamily A member 1 homolog [Homarus americanus]XP_042220134.1 transient receptor potential cation channel subfamily A member 1 homolog [Homarus americanus]XP_042220135.1 transient receptor potential cation channel subfamily A member 1 homolog [Homarus americanus]XP_042220136.1 transient receptor potential cation channel subfamily A member 1
MPTRDEEEEEDAEAHQKLLPGMENNGDVVLTMEELAQVATGVDYKEGGGGDGRGGQQLKKVKKIRDKTETHRAAEVGDTVRLQQMVKRQPQDVFQQDEDGNTPLHLAAKGIYLDCCKVLLGADNKAVNLKNKNGNSPLLLSIATGKNSTEITELLINNGSKTDATNKGKSTALHIASEKGNIETVKLLLKFDASIVRAKDAELQVPLHLAARYGHCMVCEELVKGGTDLNARDERGYTPLHWAAKMGFSKCCSQLLELEAQVNSVDKKRNTPLHLLCASGKEKPDCAKVLFKHGANANAQNEKGETPFHLSHHASTEVSRTFLGQEVDLLVVDNAGRTALHYAAERKKSNHLEFVLSMKGISKELINKPNKQGKIALHIAIENKVIDSCRLLIKAGADGNISCGSQGTALHMAADKGLDEICDFLITRGVKVDVKNSKALTPLHMAARAGHHKCCLALCKKNASASITDADGMLALHHAAKGKHSFCCHVLLEKYPSLINKADKCGKTPLHTAVEAKSIECCKVLTTQKTDLWARSNHGSSIKLAYDQKCHDIFKFLLHFEGVNNKNKSERDIDFRDLLENTLESQDRILVESIIDSCFWEEALKPYNTSADKTCVEKQKNGNLRLLVKNYPDLAEKVLDKCTPSKPDETEDGPAERHYLVHFLDEVYPTPEQEDSNSGEVFDNETGRLVKGMKVAAVNQAWRHDHLLQWVIRHNRLSLLHHPLISHWLRYKWHHYIKYQHYARLTLACVMAVLLTTFTAISWDWQYMGLRYNITQRMVCYHGAQDLVGPEVNQLLEDEGEIPNSLGISILVIAGLWMLHIVYEIVMLRERYFKIENFLILLCLVASILFVGNFTTCSRNTYVREDWQWLASVASVFTAWLCVFLLMSNERWCSPIIFHINRLVRTLFKILTPLFAIAAVILAAYKIAAKGKTTYNQFWNNVVQIFSYHWISTSFYVALIIVICSVMFDKSIYTHSKKYMNLHIVATVKMTLDFDLLYPFLRKKYYVAWLPSHTGKRSQCRSGFLCGWLSRLRKKDTEDTLGEIEDQWDAEDPFHIVRQKIDKLQQDVTEVHELLKDLKGSIGALGKN